MASKTLVVLAAGMGSRYGGLKQMDPIGPGGAFLLDYSVYDAIRAGFDCVTFVIRHDIEDDFRARVSRRIEPHIEVRHAFQSLDALPEGYALPEGRSKPWGTAHALLCAADQIDDAFAVINADDFYGRSAYASLASHLDTNRDPAAHCMVAYPLGGTLSTSGSVSRGICDVNAEGLLRSVTETHEIRDESGVIQSDAGVLEHATPVSMNCWGLQASFMDAVRDAFPRFLDATGDDPKAEFYVPAIADAGIHDGSMSFSVLHSSDLWLGVTNKDDRATAVNALRAQVDAGNYPETLWA